MHLCCWAVVHTHVHTLKPWLSVFKWFCFLHAMHVFLNAGHSLWLCAALKYAQLSILYFYSVIWVDVTYLFQYSYHYGCDQSLLHFSLCLIFTKLESSTSQKRANIAYKIDTGSYRNLMLFRVFRMLFPRSNIMSNAFFCTLYISTLWAHFSTCSLSISLMFLWPVSSSIISCVISYSFMLLINCSLNHLFCSL